MYECWTTQRKNIQFETLRITLVAFVKLQLSAQL